MGGTLAPEQTPGGGLTMVVTLPAATTGSPTQRAGDLVS
jgi:two-component system sensor histidine kinase KdpD